MKKFIVLLLILLTACFPAFQPMILATATTGNIYYVSTSGNDTNTGTQASPWRTVQKAANTMIVGDTVNVLAGSYGERVYATTNSGKSGSPITFQAQGNAVIKGFIIKADYITVNGFEIANNDANNVGVQIKGAYNIIENNYLHHLSQTGIELYAYVSDNTTLVTHDNIIRNNRLYYIQSSGISVSGRNNIIENNDVSGIQQCLPINTYCSDADGILFFGQGHIIRGNYIHDISFGPPGLNPSIGDYVNDAHIDCFQTWASTIFEKASDILFEWNYCDNLQFQNTYEKGQGWMVPNGATNITFRNNVVRAYRGINNNGVTNFANNIYIYNNTFINDLSFAAQPDVAELYNATDSIIKNNIFYNQKNGTIDTNGDVPAAGMVIDYNLVYNTDGSLPKFFDYPQLHELRKVDPLFVDAAGKDYHLQPNSPACTGGENGTYIGAFPCEVSITPVVTNTYTAAPTFTKTPTASITATKTQVPSLTPTRTPTRTPTKMLTLTPTMTNTATASFTPTSTVTLVPTVQDPICVYVTWNRGLNMRVTSMFDPSYLGEGGLAVNISKETTLKVKAVFDNKEGKWAEFNQWTYFAMWLNSKNQKYAEVVVCQ